MYLSLKGSLGHTAITDRVGESLLQIAEGSSAAYSLRNLGSDSPSVVRVRRESDNAERDFTAQDINTSVVENWVNEQIIPPLDLRELTPTGRDGPLIEATAAYSLRSLGTNQWSYGGDTVTYTSDFSAGTDGWYADPASSATTTPDPVGTLDVLQYTIDTETTAKYLSLTSLNVGQQYLVQAEVYVPSSNVNLDSIVLMDGSGFMATSYLGIQRDEWVAVSTVGTANLYNINIRGASGTTASAYNGFQGNGTDVFYARNVVISETLGDSNYLPAGKYVTQVRRTSDDQVRSFTAAEVTDGTLLAWVNAEYLYPARGISETSQTYFNVTKTDDRNFRIVSDLTNDGLSDTKYIQLLAPQDGLVLGKQRLTFDVDVNSGDISNYMLRLSYRDVQTDLQPVAGSNSFEFVITDDGASPDPQIYFAIHEASSFDISISNLQIHKIENDGHVSTWYDQSTTAGVPNANHATQGTAASQPKIVDAGALLTDGIDFDGSSHFFDIDFGSNLSQPNSIFMVHQSDSVLEADNEFFDEKDTTGQRTLLDVTTAGEERRYRILAQNNLSTTNAQVTTDKNLVVGIYNGSNSSLSLNGNVSNFTNSVGGDSIARLSAIGYSEGTNNYYDGTMGEFIIYNSDQSDNRTALEANIGEVYGISGIPAYDNTVNGFVEAWYDQSGNGYDAVQLTASQQPKIVDAGVKVVDRDGKVALNGKGAKLDLPNDVPMLSSDGTYSLFAVVDFDDQRNGNDQFNDILRFSSKTNGGAASLRKPLIYLNQSTGNLSSTGPSWTAGSVPYTLAGVLSVQLLTNIANPALPTGNNTLYADGALVGSANNATSVNTETRLQIDSHIFDNQETTVTHFLSEVIYYPSDESAKRAAIEDNIDNHYGITSAGSYVNAAGDSYINAAGDTYLQP